MRTFVCKACGTKVEARALTAGHKCPSARGKFTTFTLVGGAPLVSATVTGRNGVVRKVLA